MRCKLLVLLVLLPALALRAQTPERPMTFTIWLPDSIANLGAETLSLFGSYTDAFAAANELHALIRIKKASDVGGILSTLRSAQPVAPAALPVITLLRRSEMVLAAQENLIQPLDGRVDQALLGGFGGTTELCVSGERLVGLPFLIDVQHLIYRPTAGVRYTEWDFDSVLERAAPLQFAGNITGGVSVPLLSQYLSAIAQRAPQPSLRYDAVTLRTVLDFYERARADGMIDEQTLVYSSPLQYTAALNEAGNRQWIVYASQYLRLRQIDRSVRAAPIPTPDGTPLTILEGWCWVVVATDAAQQAALDYALGLSSGTITQDIARSTLLLPAQPALLEGLFDAATVRFYAQLLQRTDVPRFDPASVTVGRAIQDAFRAVVTGASAEEAVRAASAALGG